MPSKEEDLSLDLQNSHKKLTVVACTCIPENHETSVCPGNNRNCECSAAGTAPSTHEFEGNLGYVRRL